MEKDTIIYPNEVPFSLGDDDEAILLDGHIPEVDDVVDLEEGNASNAHQFANNIQLQTTPDGKHGSTEAFVATPAVGMTYESWEEIDLHFRCYAKQCGFAVSRVGAGYRQKDGIITKIKRNVTWRCEQWGVNKSDSDEAAIIVPATNVPNTRSRAARSKANDVAAPTSRQTSVGQGGVAVHEGKTKRCNCPVKLYASASKDGSVWTIKTAILQHEGHEPSPSRARYISEYRQAAWNQSIRRRLFNDLQAGIKIPQIHRGLAQERNGVENFPLTQLDLRNAVTKKRQLETKGGDANGMYAYLRRMSEDNDQFFYSYRLDEHGSLKDVMWVDSRSRAAYQCFGDVVCFDSTYITNEYELPFANFVGVNHHGQTILLGCALLSHEDSETFEWLFSKWLSCMGKAPGGILTDQDAAMKKALVKVMPNVRHRWCLWHILQKFYQRLGSYDLYESITEELQNAIYDSLTPEEFKQSWDAVIKTYHLEDNDWLRGLYENCEMWIPAYMKHMFWAGMKTTQRSESINNFFDNFVCKKTRLYEFVQQYVNAMEYRMNDEKAADADSARYLLNTVTNFPAEKIFRKFYTNGKFAEVQVECAKTIYVRPVKIEQIGQDVLDITLTDRHYILNKKNRKEYATSKRRQYKVLFNKVTKEAECVCKMFECHGIICRHIIAVYDAHDIPDIPPKYILDRWRKDIKRKHTKIKVAYYDACTTEEDVDLVLEMISKTKGLIAERRAKAKSSAQGDNIRGTPSSVGNQQARGRTTTDCNGEVPEHIGDEVPPLNCSNDEGSVDGGSQDTTPNIGDPPLKKKPPHRTREKRFLSCVERATTKKRGKAGRSQVDAPGSAAYKAPIPAYTAGMTTANIEGCSLAFESFQPIEAPRFPGHQPPYAYVDQRPVLRNYPTSAYPPNGYVDHRPSLQHYPSSAYPLNYPFHYAPRPAGENNHYLDPIVPDTGLGFAQPRPF